MGISLKQTCHPFFSKRQHPLYALTVCIHRAETLLLTCANRRHFDRWIIVTTPDDLPTQKLARRLKLELILVSVGDLGPFDAAYNKAEYINAGLAAIDGAAWVLILDADALLPSLFRSFLNQYTLNHKCLYGLRGRSMCNTISQFLGVLPFEPWMFNLEESRIPAGYFQLFFRYDKNILYRRSDPARRVHDDRRFADLFNWALLPLTCLHIGVDSMQHRSWRGTIDTLIRETGDDETLDPNVISSVLRQHAEQEVVSIVNRCASIGGNSLILGSPSGSVIDAVSKRSGTVFWLRNPAFPRFQSKDRVALELAFDSFESPHLTNVILLHGVADEIRKMLYHTPINRIVILTHFDDVDWVEWVPLLQSGLRESAEVIGCCFGWQISSFSTSAVVKIFGCPEQITRHGAWYRKVSHFHARHSSQEAGNQMAVIYFVKESGEYADLARSLLALKTIWPGSVLLLAPKPTAELLFLARRFKADIVCGIANIEEAIAQSSFELSIFVPPRSPITEIPRRLLPLTAAYKVTLDAAAIDYKHLNGTGFTVQRQAAVANGDCKSIIIRSFDNAARGNASSNHATLQSDALVIRTLAEEILCYPSILVATVVTESSVEVFKNVVLTWKLPRPPIVLGSRRTLASLADVPYISCMLVEDEDPDKNPVALTVRKLAADLRSDWLVCLSPTIAALPGARLLYEDEHAAFDYISSGMRLSQRFDEFIYLHSVVRFSYPFAAIRAKLAQVLAVTSIPESHGAAPGWHDIIGADGYKHTTQDIREWGWVGVNSIL